MTRRTRTQASARKPRFAGTCLLKILFSTAVAGNPGVESVKVRPGLGMSPLTDLLFKDSASGNTTCRCLSLYTLWGPSPGAR